MAPKKSGGKRKRRGGGHSLESLRNRFDLDDEFKREYERFHLGVGAAKKANFELKFLVGNLNATFENGTSIYDAFAGVSPLESELVEVARSKRAEHEKILQRWNAISERFSQLSDSEELKRIEGLAKESEIAARDSKMVAYSRAQAKLEKLETASAADTVRQKQQRIVDTAKEQYYALNSELLARLREANTLLRPLTQKLLTNIGSSLGSLFGDGCCETPVDALPICPNGSEVSSPSATSPSLATHLTTGESVAASPEAAHKMSDPPLPRGHKDPIFEDRTIDASQTLSPAEMEKMRSLMKDGSMLKKMEDLSKSRGGVHDQSAAGGKEDLERWARRREVQTVSTHQKIEDRERGGLQTNVELSPLEVVFNKSDSDVVPLNKPVSVTFEIKNTGLHAAKWSITAPRRQNYSLTFTPNRGTIKRPGKAQKVKATIVITSPPNLFFTMTCNVEGLNEAKFFTVRARCESGAFGVHLDSLEFEQDHGYNVPVVLARMRRGIYSNGGLTTEGIFRLAGDVLEMQKAKQELNTNTFVEARDVNCLANLIKIWFREMPRHILDFIPPDVLNTVKTEEDLLQAKKHVPQEERNCLDWLVEILCDVQDNSHVTRMGFKNLSIVVAPNLYQSQSLNPIEIIMFTQKAVNFLYLCLTRRQKEREAIKIAEGDVLALRDEAADRMERPPVNDDVAPDVTAGVGMFSGPQEIPAPPVTGEATDIIGSPPPAFRKAEEPVGGGDAPPEFVSESPPMNVIAPTEPLPDFQGALQKEPVDEIFVDPVAEDVQPEDLPAVDERLDMEEPPMEDLPAEEALPEEHLVEEPPVEEPPVEEQPPEDPIVEDLGFDEPPELGPMEAAAVHVVAPLENAPTWDVPANDSRLGDEALEDPLDDAVGDSAFSGTGETLASDIVE